MYNCKIVQLLCTIYTVHIYKFTLEYFYQLFYIVLYRNNGLQGAVRLQKMRQNMEMRSMQWTDLCC